CSWFSTRNRHLRPSSTSLTGHTGKQCRAGASPRTLTKRRPGAPPNQTMKPTRPLQENLRGVATTPSCALSLSRQAFSWRSMIRHANPEDAKAVATLYYNTVRRINSRDYGIAQIEAWAGAAPDEAKWRERQNNRVTFVDEHDGVIRGFAELEDDGHIGA